MTTNAKPTAKKKPAAPPAPAFDAATAIERPHVHLFPHEKTGRTVGFVQPSAKPDEVDLFGVNRAYIATEPAAIVPAIPKPPAKPTPPAPAPVEAAPAA